MVKKNWVQWPCILAIGDTVPYNGQFGSLVYMPRFEGQSLNTQGINFKLKWKLGLLISFLIFAKTVWHLHPIRCRPPCSPSLMGHSSNVLGQTPGVFASMLNPKTRESSPLVVNSPQSRLMFCVLSHPEAGIIPQYLFPGIPSWLLGYREAISFTSFGN